MSMLPNGRSYCPGVLVGNWFEDIALETDKIKDYLDKRDKGDLLCVQRKGIKETIKSKVEVSTTPDGLVHFGDHVLVINPETADKSRPHHALNMTWTDLFLHNYEETICMESGKVAASICNLSPNYRNVFTITSCDGSHLGEVLRYSQPFYLVAANGRMHLSSDRFDFQYLTKWSRQPQVTVESTPHYLSEWNVKPFNASARLELEYSPVPANTKIVIAHCKTNRNLCLEPHPFKSSFGNEFEVSVHTCLDSHKAETSVNHWMLVMHCPGDCFYPPIEPNSDITSSQCPASGCYDACDATERLKEKFEGCCCQPGSCCQQSPCQQSACQQSNFQPSGCCQQSNCQPSSCQQSDCKQSNCQKSNSQKSNSQPDSCQKSNRSQSHCKSCCQKSNSHKSSCQSSGCQKSSCQSSGCQKSSCQSSGCEKSSCQSSGCQK